jgi:hypothetical protein
MAQSWAPLVASPVPYGAPTAVLWVKLTKPGEETGISGLFVESHSDFVLMKTVINGKLRNYFVFRNDIWLLGFVQLITFLEMPFICPRGMIRLTTTTHSQFLQKTSYALSQYPFQQVRSGKTLC